MSMVQPKLLRLPLLYCASVDLVLNISMEFIQSEKLIKANTSSHLPILLLDHLNSELLFSNLKLNMACFLNFILHLHLHLF